MKPSAGYKQHLDWLTMDLNTAETITVQDYKRTKNYYEGKYTYTVLTLRVKQVAHESKTELQRKRPKLKEH